MQNTKDFDYFSSIENSVLLIYREIKRVIYKIALNKILKHIDYTNRVICKFVNNISK